MVLSKVTVVGCRVQRWMFVYCLCVHNGWFLKYASRYWSSSLCCWAVVFLLSYSMKTALKMMVKYEFLIANNKSLRISGFQSWYKQWFYGNRSNFAHFQTTDNFSIIFNLCRTLVWIILKFSMCSLTVAARYIIKASFLAHILN